MKQLNRTAQRGEVRQQFDSEQTVLTRVLQIRETIFCGVLGLDDQ